MICQSLASQTVSSVVGSGSLGQLLWRNPLQQDTDGLISEEFSLHRVHVMVLAEIWLFGFGGNDEWLMQAHLVGIRSGFQLYRRAMVPWCLVRTASCTRLTYMCI